MAKSSKVEDYWREHYIENLFKELTQILLRRMPADPIIAIVEHLQKKFPKSFKISPDNNTSLLSKSIANNLPRQSITSTHSDLQNETIDDVQIGRRLSNQSQISEMVTIPPIGSAFTDLLKQDTNSSRLPPELNLKNLVFANRLGQQVVKMRKNIRSDHEILEEEVIKPTQTKSLTINSLSEDLGNTPIHEEPSIPQLIKYKQQIRTENDRRLHREELAELAKHQRHKEQFLQSDLSAKPEEIQQQNFNQDESLSQVVPGEAKTNIKLPYQLTVKSKEEEEILQDENVFHLRKQRERGRQRIKLPTSRSNTPFIRGQYLTDLRSTLKRDDENTICKTCGNVLNDKENQSIVYSQQNSAAPTSRSIQPQPSSSSSQSIETTSGAVDDWFESAPHQSNLRAPNDTIPPPAGSSTFRRNLFQAITDPVEHRPPIRPLILTDDDEEIKPTRTLTPKMSESGIFARSPESKIRRSSSSRSTSSPVPKKHQPDTNQPLAPPISSTNNRRMSGWSVREHSPNDSDEN